MCTWHGSILSSIVIGCLGVAAFADQGITEQKPSGYYAIPIKGVIGRDFTAGQMEGHLKEAERLKPAVVLLEIDSGGGNIDHAEQIVDLIIKHKDVTFIAYVRKALSAAATITLACEKIFVTECATIGGAVSYRVDAKGKVEVLPADVAEKFQSIWRAACRKAAQHGGHPSLMAEAMVDPAFALTMRRVGEQVELERDGHGKVLKAKGRILTLTAREAVSCGLADALVQGVETLGEQLAISNWANAVEERKSVVAEPMPESLGEKTFANPAALYATLYRKFVALGLTDEQTDLQRKKAIEQWNSWFNCQHLTGRRVEWPLTVIEVSDSEVRMVPDVGWVVGSGRPSVGPAQLAGGIFGPSMSWGEFRSLPSRYNLRRFRQYMSYFEYLARKNARYPYKVITKSEAEPRVFICAWVSRAAEPALVETSPDERLTLVGQIARAKPYGTRDGLLVLDVVLDICTANKHDETTETSEPAQSERPSPNLECRSWLAMARNFLRAGLPNKTMEYAEKVLDNYADSEYADDAHKLCQQALQMMRTTEQE